MKAHGKRGQWWVTIGNGFIRYPSVGVMRVKNGHYLQRYQRSKKKSEELIEAIKDMGKVVIAQEELLPHGTYKRKTPDGHIGLFEVLNFNVTHVGMLKCVEFDVGKCLLPLEG
jgi:hypothetical protein